MKPKAFLCRSPIGLFAFSEGGELLHYRLFSAKPENALEEFESGNIEGLESFEITDSADSYVFLRKHLREYATSLGFVSGNRELNEFLSRFAEMLSLKRMKSLISRDRLIIQASNALEDIIKIQNLVFERLREWYMLHYPELKQKDVAELVARYGRRENLPGYKGSVGAALTDADEQILREYAATALAVARQRKALERYIENSAKEIMPNFSSLIEPLLAGRFLAMAGSLERLAKMPASTIQLLGAEKALFRHLRKQGKSPKFGIIFLDSRVQNAPDAKKGRVARLLAAKLMLAARIDFYSKRDESRKLNDELKKELERL